MDNATHTATKDRRHFYNPTTATELCAACAPAPAARKGWKVVARGEHDGCENCGE